MRVEEDVDIKRIADETAGFSGADIANLVNQAAILASKAGRDALTDLDFKEAYKKINEVAE